MVGILTNNKQIITVKKINVREYRRGNQKWKIQRNWQNRVHKTKTNKTITQHEVRLSGPEV
jgi:hypothetical protein